MVSLIRSYISCHVCTCSDFNLCFWTPGIHRLSHCPIYNSQNVFFCFHLQNKMSRTSISALSSVASLNLNSCTIPSRKIIYTYIALFVVITIGTDTYIQSPELFEVLFSSHLFSKGQFTDFYAQEYLRYHIEVWLHGSMREGIACAPNQTKKERVDKQYVVKKKWRQTGWKVQ